MWSLTGGIMQMERETHDAGPTANDPSDMLGRRLVPGPMQKLKRK